ncbi:MAG: hypothetical protein Ct9H300mP19_03170 [Dehalococcoidia bacterium]|nr:MAG: hypothetical protein Ct9H300mP19_03170 [Dehalococcoidia bacterium]
MNLIKRMAADYPVTAKCFLVLVYTSFDESSRLGDFRGNLKFRGMVMLPIGKHNQSLATHDKKVIRSGEGVT